MIFLNAWTLLLIPVVIAGVFFIKKPPQEIHCLQFSCGELLACFKPTWKTFLAKHIIYLRMIILCLFLLALGRPVSPLKDGIVRSECIDIVLALDCSRSMLAEDFKRNGKHKNRLRVAKEVVKDFIGARQNDRIAIVAFAAHAYTVCPLTFDYD
jgi:Ca-activated chloride channel homolog